MSMTYASTGVNDEVFMPWIRNESEKYLKERLPNEPHCTKQEGMQLHANRRKRLGETYCAYLEELVWLNVAESDERF